MADGAQAESRDEGAAKEELAGEARLLRRTRWRLVLWSGVSTLVVLLVLGAALYAVVANTLVQSSVQQLHDRIDPIVAFMTGQPTASQDLRVFQGFGLGSGNTGLFIFDTRGRLVLFRPDRPVDVPNGLPDDASMTAATAASDGTTVRLATLQTRTQDAAIVQSVPVRLMTRRVEAVDGNTYFVEALQDRSTEVGTLEALLEVLLVGGLLVVVVAIGFGTVYAQRALIPIRVSLGAQREALRRQREFAADASHELRTPLTVIRSSVEHLARHPDKPVGEQREALDDIEAEVSNLASLVDDLLLLARSDSGAVALERMPLDLGDVAFEAAGALGRTAEDRGVHVEVDPEPTMLEGDPARLRQLVTILVDNAIRHSPRDGRVRVVVRPAGTMASVEVTDEGPGVREEDMPHVFDRFWRAPGAPSGGTGLGLAIARWIVERHGGRIGVANRPEGGAAFRAELPTTGPADASPSRADATPPPMLLG